MMRARRHAEDNYWEVTDTASGRWWTVAIDSPDLILNEDLRSVKATGALGKKILAAVDRWIDAHDAEEGEK